MSTISSPFKLEGKPIYKTTISSHSKKKKKNILITDKIIKNQNIQINNFLWKKIKFTTFKESEKRDGIKSKTKKLKKLKKRNKPKIFGINDGRWKENELLNFLNGIYNCGTKWLKVQNLVATRSCKQVRSHAQKFFLKLKHFKDSELGFDFSLDAIKSLADIIDIVKEYEIKNKCENILSLLNKKLSLQIMKNNNHNNKNNLNQNKEEDALVKNNTKRINNQSMNEDNDNDNDRNVKKTIIKNNRKKNKKKLKNINNIFQNNVEEDKNENKEIIENKNKYEENYLDNNNSLFICDNNFDNSNLFVFEINNKKIPLFPSLIEEPLTNSLMNMEYFY